MKQACYVFLSFSLATQAVWNFPKGKPSLTRFTPDNLSKQCRAKVPMSEDKWILPHYTQCAIGKLHQVIDTWDISFREFFIHYYVGMRNTVGTIQALFYNCPGSIML